MKVNKKIEKLLEQGEIEKAVGMMIKLSDDWINPNSISATTPAFFKVFERTYYVYDNNIDFSDAFDSTQEALIDFLTKIENIEERLKVWDIYGQPENPDEIFEKGGDAVFILDYTNTPLTDEEGNIAVYSADDAVAFVYAQGAENIDKWNVYQYKGTTYGQAKDSF